jgi:hypothetical protein
MRRIMHAVGALLAVMVASAQEPSQVLRITLNPADDELVWTNLGQKTITAAVMRGNPPLSGPDWRNYSPMDIGGSEPLKPRASYTFKFVASPGITAIDPAAVVFDDGSVVGAANAAGVDFVQGIFISRRSQAEEWKKFRDSLGSDPTAETFLRAARAMQPDQNHSARDAVRMEVQSKAAAINADIQSHILSPEQAAEQVRAWTSGKADEMARRAIRKAAL